MTTQVAAAWPLGAASVSQWQGTPRPPRGREVAAGGVDRVFADAVHAVATALEAKDAYTRNHSKRVSRYAVEIARELGMRARKLREIKLGGQLHDIGKIGVPDELLLKAGPLTGQQYRRVMQHTLTGEQILRPLLRQHPLVLAVVRWHHERVDGRGHPDGLRGEEIPLAARIVAVADAFDAMTSARAYRSALPTAVALLELERGAGSQFDAECVHAFRQALARLPTIRRAISARKWQSSACMRSAATGAVPPDLPGRWIVCTRYRGGSRLGALRNRERSPPERVAPGRTDDQYETAYPEKCRR